MSQWKVRMVSEHKIRNMRAAILEASHLHAEMVALLAGTKRHPKPAQGALVFVKDLTSLVVAHLEANLR